MDNGASSYRRFLDGDESDFESIMRELFRGLVFFIDGFVHDCKAHPSNNSKPHRINIKKHHHMLRFQKPENRSIWWLFLYFWLCSRFQKQKRGEHR